MSGEELALQTQLLLQEANQVVQHQEVENVLEPPATEFEAAKNALLEKLKRKKEANRAQQQALNLRRYGSTATKQTELFSPRKRQALKLPVAATAASSARKKQDMMAKLRSQAVQQGAENVAKMFGFTTSKAHLERLNELEKKKILEDELREKVGKAKELKEKEKQAQAMEVEEEDEEDEDEEQAQENAEMENAQTEEAAENSEEMDVEAASIEKAGDTAEHEELDSVVVVKRWNRIRKQEAEEEDGNEADSEQDDKDGDDDADDAMDVVADTSVDTHEETSDNTHELAAPTATDGDVASKPKTPSKPKDKAAGYRELLRAETQQNRRRKRLVKGGGDNFVESEAEEDEEEDVLKIGGLGDFGFGVPQAKTQESKEAEEERNALKLREGDLDHIVDDLSDEERAQEQDLEEMFRREQEDQDRQQVKEVMRNVKEGFGRNRRAFSGLHSGSGARGRFNLDELVAADGSKAEAARLGLLESDEELSGDEEGKKNKAGEEGEEEEEEDEEGEMERALRERFLNQPKIYVTSSESGSDDEEEDEAAKAKKEENDEMASDEERERQQMKLFSEKARINRRMQRMKDMQRQIAIENNEGDPDAKKKAIPNVLLEEDEDSQELMHLLNRTDVEAAPLSTSSSSQTKTRADRPRPKLGRFNSYGGITSSSRGSSSFSRVIGHCKLFSANSTGGAPSKGFVFTSFSSDKPEEGDENAVPNNDDAMPAARPVLGKSKSWGNSVNASTKRRGAPAGKASTSNKKRKSGGLFSVLSSYQCVSSTSQSQE